MSKISRKLLSLTKIGLVSLVFIASFDFDVQQRKLSFLSIQPAQANSCDTTIRNVSFTGRTSGSMTGKPNINTMLRSSTSTSSSILRQIPPNTMLTFSGWTYGQAIADIWTNQLDYRWFRVSYNGQTGWVASAVIAGNPPNSTLAPNCQTSGWVLPWQTGVTASVSQGWHFDIYTQSYNAIDFALPAGTPVRAPVSSTVLDSCNAGNNHRALKLRAANGQIYTIAHVTTGTVKTNYQAGEVIGTVAGDKPWNNCAKSTGPHLHVAFPARPFTMGGYTFGNSIPSSVTSR